MYATHARACVHACWHACMYACMHACMCMMDSLCGCTSYEEIKKNKSQEIFVSAIVDERNWDDFAQIYHCEEKVNGLADGKFLSECRRAILTQALASLCTSWQQTADAVCKEATVMSKAITSVPGGGKGKGKGKGNSSDDVQLILELQDIVTMGDAIGWVQHKEFGSQDLFCYTVATNLEGRRYT